LDNGHILVVDDQREICDLVQEYLSSEGYYRVSTAQDGAGMRRVMAQSPIDLVILDLILPGEDGLTLARSIRDETNVGIIILSGRGEPVERIIGLEMGADDYLPKPFLPRDLLARVKSVLRRTSPRTTEEQAQARSKAQFAGWTLDLLRRVLYSPSDKEVDLTRGEFDLLAAFVKNPNQVLTRDRLLDREAGPEDRTIDVQVLRLRRKLKIDPKNPTIIKMVRGRGYTLIPEVQSLW
jgi:two-component system, OmpR family, response regulator